MEQNRGTKIIAIAALFVAVIGLSIGFAAFSSTLTISASAEVTPSSDTFNVDFSALSTKVSTDDIVAETNSSDVVATDAKIDNSGEPKISNLSATFTEPGQEAKYVFYAYNAGEYVAYLRSILFLNVDGEDSVRVCTSDGDATDAYVQAACDDITLSIQVGADGETTGTKNSITGHALDKQAAELITVKISYSEYGDRADGDFTVDFGSIVLDYKTVDGTSND